MKKLPKKSSSPLNKKGFRQFLTTFMIMFVGFMFINTVLYYSDFSYSSIIASLVLSFFMALVNIISSRWLIMTEKSIELKDLPIVFIFKHVMIFFVAAELTQYLLEYQQFSYHSLKDGIQFSFLIALYLTIFWYRKEYSR
ncbi:MAG: hypothetical protein CENE_01337 [Candidatus Celerinatantimonas neptuna]|nr:MAG: hypothetical protein CENE_01337 [Candidatus Celerinatantimonas neptuna]